MSSNPKEVQAVGCERLMLVQCEDNLILRNYADQLLFLKEKFFVSGAVECIERVFVLLHSLQVIRSLN